LLHFDIFFLKRKSYRWSNCYQSWWNNALLYRGSQRKSEVHYLICFEK